jgi:hypothetical protein
MYKNISASIKSAIDELASYVKKYGEQSAGHNTKVVLILLKEGIDKEQPNERVLRAFKDVCTTIAVTNEDASFAPLVFKIYEQLEKELPEFKKLDLLRMDFGKGNPI